MSSVNRDESQGSLLPPDLAEVESGLHSFHVAAGRLDRERLMFELGCEAVRRKIAKSSCELTGTAKSSRFWPASVAALLLLSAGLGIAMVARPERIVVVERIVAVSEPTAQPAASLAEPDRSAQQRDVADVAVSRGGQYFTQRQIAVMQTLESMPVTSRGLSETASTHDEESPLTARELWKTWSEENSKPQPAQANEPAWLRWLNPEAWL